MVLLHSEGFAAPASFVAVNNVWGFRKGKRRKLLQDLQALAHACLDKSLCFPNKVEGFAPSSSDLVFSAQMMPQFH